MNPPVDDGAADRGRTLTTRDHVALRRALDERESWLMERVLHYAHAHGYTRYTSTLVEAWRMSIRGLSASVLMALDDGLMVPELGPHVDPIRDPLCRFGVEEARLHRGRGVNLQMFLGLYKYYRQSYHDLLDRLDLDDPPTAHLFFDRVFDRTEIAYTQEWSGTSAEEQIHSLSIANLHAVNEKNRLLTLVESLPMAAMLADETDTIVLSNAAAAVLLGCDRARDGEYAHLEPIAPPGWLTGLLQTTTREHNVEHRIETQVVIATPSGERTFAVSINAMRDISEKFVGHAIAMLDVTELRNAEAALRTALTELQRAQHTIVQTQKLEAIGELAAGVAHESNTPIQFVGDNLRFLETSFAEVISCLDALDELGCADEPGSCVQIVQRALAATAGVDLPYLREEVPLAIGQSLDGVERVAHIVRALKNVAHPDAEVPVLADVNELIRNVTVVTRNEWKYHSTLETELDGDLQPINCFAGPLAQVLVNLIVNAVDAIEERRKLDPEHHGEIRVVSRAYDSGVRISVSDNGNGIPEHIRSRVFDPFFTTKDVGEGTGQGLAIAWSVVVGQHGGAITLESTEGAGTTFSIEVPESPLSPSEAAAA